MGRFLRENWLWIVLPFVVVLGAMIVLMLVAGGDEATAPFQYNVF